MECPRCGKCERLSEWTAVDEATCRILHGLTASGLPVMWPVDATAALVTADCGAFYGWVA